MGKITVRDIARKSNVSTATVSRILSGRGGHRFSTVKLVENTMAEMGMKINLFCPGTDTVGVLTHAAYDFGGSPYSNAILNMLQKELALNGFLLLIIPVIPSRLSLSYIRRIVEEHRLLGLAVLEYHHMDNLSAQLASLPVPVVCLGNTESSEVVNQVACDNLQAGIIAAQSLIAENRHRNAGIISVVNPDECHQLRQQGFRSSWQAANNRRVTWKFEGNPDRDCGEAMVRELEQLPLSRRPSALFSTYSKLAIELLNALDRSTLSIPGDIALYSLEDAAELAFLRNRIGVVRQPCGAMGENAARMLADLINRRETERKIILNCDISTIPKGE